MATTSLFVPSIGREGRQVGMIFARAALTNAFDVAMSEAGHRPRADVRSLVIDEMLVDTGATTLGLPVDIIRRLGLQHSEDVQVRTANGNAIVGLYGGVHLTIEGRRGLFECLALPEGSTPLLGCIPMEMMGIEPDLANRKLRLLPNRGKDTYLFLY